jgi:hypothetical protein
LQRVGLLGAAPAEAPTDAVMFRADVLQCPVFIWILTPRFKFERFIPTGFKFEAALRNPQMCLRAIRVGECDASGMHASADAVER